MRPYKVRMPPASRLLNSKVIQSIGASQAASGACGSGHMQNGVWLYSDPQQPFVVREVRTALAWDLESFDAWLFGQTHWNSYPKARQRMMELRAQLSSACLTNPSNPTRREQDIKSIFRATRKICLRLNNLPDAVRQHMLAVVDYKAAPSGTKMDAKSTARALRLYEDRVRSGQKYGAQTELAKLYGVSLATIRKVLQSKNCI